MDDLRPDALATVAARVVAWHNRHPLARRITAEQVQSVGYVALPFLAPASKPAAAGKPAAEPAATAAPAAQAAPDAGKSLRERALERAQAQPAAAPQAAPPPAAKAAAPKADKPAPLQAAFSEDFIAPLAVGRVARWAAEHGAMAARPPRDGPLREVAVDRALAGARSELLTLYTLTAMVEVRGKRVRMLLGAGSGSNAVIGNRLWSTPRLAVGSSLMGAGATAAALSYVLMPAPPVQAVATPPTPSPQAIAPAASIPSIRPPALRASAAAEMATLQAVLAASSPQPVASGSAPHAPEVAAHAGALPGPTAGAATQAIRHGAVSGVASEAASAPALAVAAAPPVDVEPTLGRVVLPPLGLPKGDGSVAALHARRQAALATAGLPVTALAPQASTALQAPAQATAPDARSPSTARRPGGAATPAEVQHDKPAPAAGSPLPAAMAPTPAQPAAAPKPPSSYAVSSRLLRTRAEAEQTQSAMRALLAAAGQTAAHVELVPAGEDWRVVGWPFAQRAQADSASKLLAARGMRVTVIDF
jgi:hypothetical protein